jgi:Zn-finger nucleic acid-binding protein
MKPNKNEDEHIWVQEMRLRIAKLEKEQQAESEAEKLRLKEAHWMHCPKCGQKLSPEECGSVEIDVCPSCKGVWLDKGELGAIVESAHQGSFFHTCLRILRGRQPQVIPAGGGTSDANKVNKPDRLAERTDSA